MTPCFYIIFWLHIMYIFHCVKDQEDLNPRSKMAHLPLNPHELFFVLIRCTSRIRKEGNSSHGGK